MRLRTAPMPATTRAVAYLSSKKATKAIGSTKVRAATATVAPVFPGWVEKPRNQPPIELARKRLRFLISKTMLERTETGTQSEIAEKCGITRTTISNFIQLGKFSEPSATRFERAYGRGWIPREWLQEPLDIA